MQDILREILQLYLLYSQLVLTETGVISANCRVGWYIEQAAKQVWYTNYRAEMGRRLQNQIGMMTAELARLA